MEPMNIELISLDVSKELSFVDFIFKSIYWAFSSKALAFERTI